MAYKLSVVRTLFHQVETNITDEDRKRVDKEKIRTDLKRCGYSNWALQEGQREQLGEQKRSKTYVVLPYVGGMIERLQ